MKKLKIGVLMGGKSIEREVSFNSGRTICDHLDTHIYDVIPIFQSSAGQLFILPLRFAHRGKISDFEHRLKNEAKAISWDDLKQLVDFIYIALHGKFAEDGTLQGILEVLKIPYLGSKVLASALGMNKIFQKKILAKENIKTPKSIVISGNSISGQNKQDIEKKLKDLLNSENLNFPLIIKPSNEGSSFGISVANNIDSLLESIKIASNISSYNPGLQIEKKFLKIGVENSISVHEQDVIIEEYIKGMEFTCIIITDYITGKLIPLSVTEIVIEKDSNLFDYEQKYMPGRALKFTPARCSSENITRIQEACIKTMKVLGFTNIGRIDGFLTESNEIYIIDPNSLAGMAPSSFVFRQASEINMNHTDFINHLIKTELAQYNMLNDIESHKKNSDNKTKKLRVGVILGGRSHEKEISLESGRNILYKLSPDKYEAIPLFLNKNLEIFEINNKLLVRNSTKEIEEALTNDMLVQWSSLKDKIDFAFIGLHGAEGENGCIQGTLEMLEIPYNGSSVLTSALCMDKFKTNNFLRSQGFAVPNNLLISKDQWQDKKEECIQEIYKLNNFPLIIKPHDDGCSVLVTKAKNNLELTTAIENIFLDGKSFALIEECIKGTELTVGVIGNKSVQALPPSQVVTSKDILSIEEKFLPGAGENQTPALLSEETQELIKKTMVDAYIALNCKGYCRIDCFYQNEQESPTGKERVIILEVNTLPGMTPATCIFHQAAEVGIKPMDFIDLIIQLGLEEHKQVTVSHYFLRNKEKINNLQI